MACLLHSIYSTHEVLLFRHIENEQVVLCRRGTWTSASCMGEFQMGPIVWESENHSLITIMVVELANDRQSKSVAVEFHNSFELVCRPCEPNLHAHTPLPITPFAWPAK